MRFQTKVATMLFFSSVLGTAPAFSGEGVSRESRSEFVYTTNQISHNVSAYKIDPASGALKEVAGSPFASGKFPISVTVDHAGHFG